MSELVVINLLTFNRTEYALQVIRAIKEKLHYPDLCWYVADSGSSPTHVKAILDELKDTPVLGWHSEKYSCGKNWNVAIRQSFAAADIFLRLEDDFELTRDIDLGSYVDILQHRENVGMIRMSNMPVGCDLTSVGYDGRIYLNVLKSSEMCYSGNPGLVHRRFVDAYGFFMEHRGFPPGDYEVDMNYQVFNKPGPEIWWPVEMGEWGSFGHIGSVPSVPEVRR
jgi:hypothetical protein